jgi:hypothetical protein
VDAAQKCLIRQLRWIQIGGEHHHHLERDAQLLPVLQAQVVDAPVQRDDPAVQQIARRDHLASEVVDNQNAVVGFICSGAE